MCLGAYCKGKDSQIVNCNASSIFSMEMYYVCKVEATFRVRGGECRGYSRNYPMGDVANTHFAGD